MTVELKCDIVPNLIAHGNGLRGNVIVNGHNHNFCILNGNFFKIKLLAVVFSHH